MKGWPTVAEVREFLQQMPERAQVHAYEGEVTGIVVTLNGEDIGFLDTVTGTFGKKVE